MRTFVVILVLLAAPGCIPTTTSHSGTANDPDIVILLTDQASRKEDSDSAFRMCLEANGQLRDVNFHAISDDELIPLLASIKVSAQKPLCVIDLTLSDEEATSLSTLTTSIAKLKRAADTKKGTIIYVRLKGLTLQGGVQDNNGAD